MTISGDCHFAIALRNDILLITTKEAALLRQPLYIAKKKNRILII